MAKSPIRFPLLFLDASSQRVWAGLKREREGLISRASAAEATKSLPIGIAEALSDAAIKLAEVASIAYCRGPGSMLGIRSCVMMLRAWQSADPDWAVALYHYDSLQVGLRLARQEGVVSPEQPVSVATDARRQTWNIRSESQPSELPLLLSEAQLDALPGAVFTFDEFPSWSRPARPMESIGYRPETVFANASSLDLLQPTALPAPLQLRQTDYRKWEPSFLAKTPKTEA